MGTPSAGAEAAPSAGVVVVPSAAVEAAPWVEAAAGPSAEVAERPLAVRGVGLSARLPAAVPCRAPSLLLLLFLFPLGLGLGRLRLSKIDEARAIGAEGAGYPRKRYARRSRRLLRITWRAMVIKSVPSAVLAGSASKRREWTACPSFWAA